MTGAASLPESGVPSDQARLEAIRATANDDRDGFLERPRPLELTRRLARPFQRQERLIFRAGIGIVAGR